MEKVWQHGLFEQLPIPVTFLEGPSHKYVFANKIYREYFLNTDDYVGKTVEELIPDVKTQGFIALLDRVYQTGEHFIGKEVFFKLEKSDGKLQEFYFNFVYEPIHDENKNVMGILVGIADVTDLVLSRKRLEEKEAYYREAKEHLDLAMESARMGTWYFDLKTNQVLASEVALKIHGINKIDENIKHELFKRIHPDDKEELSDKWLFGINNQAEFSHEYRIIKDEKIHWIASRGSTKFDSAGQPVLYSGVLMDITERKEVENELAKERKLLEQANSLAERAKEESEKANKAKSDFLANMSHEIRTPLSAILGFTDLMKDSTSPYERANYAKIINRNGKSLTRIIDDILDLSKVEAGRLELEKIEFNLQNLIDEVVDLFTEQAAKKGVALLKNIDPRTPICIKSDPTRIRQILINLIGNAIKFTSEGYVQVIVESLFDSTETLKIRFSIKDTGLGLTPEQQIKLFEPFSQAETSTTRTYGGSGLGLALSKKLANALGGDVIIESTSFRKGSVFVATVEANVVLEDNDHFDIDIGTSTKNLNGVNILLVEDSLDNQTLVKLLLEKAGASVELANNGNEGFEKASTKPYDVVLMDMQMPILDGYTTTEKLRQLGFKKPILALTAHAMAEERKKATQAGCNAHLTKPLDGNLLIKTINDYIIH